MIEAVSNSQSSQGVAAFAQSSAARAAQAIKHASAKAGVDFAYLLNNAKQESGLNATAKAKTSSASGLFQFVEQTWLRMVKTYGDKYGMSEAANKITIGSDGVARVKDSEAKDAILALRNDPKSSACMAAELTNENRVALEGVLGTKAGATDLYLAHFLGAGGAAEFISEMRENPNASAASILPNAAAANKAVFYDKNGKACSLAQVYKRFAEKFDGSCPTAKYSKVAAAGTSSSSAAAQASAVGKDFAASSVAGSGGWGALSPKSSLSTPFATMMLAQMDMDNLAASSKANASRDEKKKTGLSLIAAAM